MQVTPITPLTPTECRLNRLDQCLLTNMELVAFMTIACPQVCMVTHPLDRIPLVERPLAEAPGLKSPGYCLSCLQDVNRWVRPRDWLLIPTYITAYTTLHYLFNNLKNKQFSHVQDYRTFLQTWHVFLRFPRSTRDSLPIFDDVFDFWFVSVPELFVLKRAGKVCTSEFLLFDDTKFKAARFHSLLIGWKGHVTCIQQSEQYAIFSELAGANLRLLWLVH